MSNHPWKHKVTAHSHRRVILTRGRHARDARHDRAALLHAAAVQGPDGPDGARGARQHPPNLDLDRAPPREALLEQGFSEERREPEPDSRPTALRRLASELYQPTSDPLPPEQCEGLRIVRAASREDEADVARLEVTDPDNLAFVTQTTLSVDDTARIIDALRQRFPNILGPKREDICYATTNRQDAVRQLALECQLVLVVGSVNSSNSNRLRELAERCGTPAHLLDDPAMIDPAWLKGKKAVGVTAGASAPEELVHQVIARLRELGGEDAHEIPGREENIRFSMPRALRA